MNYCEALVAEALDAMQYRYITTGWPDFLVMDGDENVVGIEVKNLTSGDKVRPNQIEAAELMLYGGIRVFTLGVIPDMKMKDKMFHWLGSTILADMPTADEEARRLQPWSDCDQVLSDLKLSDIWTQDGGSSDWHEAA